MQNPENQDGRRRVQLHLELPYKLEVGENPKVRRYLDRGWRIVQLQRVTDREVLVTLQADGSPGQGAG